jgi:hypothetical protein
MELQLHSFQNWALDEGQWSARAPAALPSDSVTPVTFGWALIWSENLSDYFVEVKIILLLPGIEPRFFGYQHETKSTHEAICVVLCHVAAVYRPLATKSVRTHIFL